MQEQKTIPYILNPSDLEDMQSLKNRVLLSMKCFHLSDCEDLSAVPVKISLWMASLVNKGNKTVKYSHYMFAYDNKN